MKIDTIAQLPSIISEQLGAICTKTLLLFDIDFTLTTPEPPAVHLNNLREHTEIHKTLCRNLNGWQIDVMHTELTITLPQLGIEAAGPAMLKQLQADNIPTLGFTASLSGKIQPSPEMPYVVQQRAKIMRQLGFQFNPPADLPNHTFSEFTEHAFGRPMLYDGILCSNGEQNPETNKGAVLLKALALMAPGFVPQRIVLVDDKVKNLTDVEQALANSHPQIQYLGLQFEGASQMASPKLTTAEYSHFWQPRIQKVRDMTL